MMKKLLLLTTLATTITISTTTTSSAQAVEVIVPIDRCLSYKYLTYPDGSQPSRYRSPDINPDCEEEYNPDADAPFGPEVIVNPENPDISIWTSRKLDVPEQYAPPEPEPVQEPLPELEPVIPEPEPIRPEPAPVVRPEPEVIPEPEVDPTVPVGTPPGGAPPNTPIKTNCRLETRDVGDSTQEVEVCETGYWEWRP